MRYGDKVTGREGAFRISPRPLNQKNKTMLDHDGNDIKVTALSAKAKELLKDYKLVQYDQTVGKNYLKDLDFTQVP